MIKKSNLKYILLIIVFLINISIFSQEIVKVSYHETIIKKKKKNNLYELYHDSCDSITIIIDNEIVFFGNIGNEFDSNSKLVYSFSVQEGDTISKTIKIKYNIEKKYTLIKWKSKYNVIEITPIFYPKYEIELIDAGKNKIPIPKKVPVKKRDDIIHVFLNQKRVPKLRDR